METIEICFVCMGGVHATIFKEKLQTLMKNQSVMQVKERCIIKMCSLQDVKFCDLIILLPMLIYRKKDLEKFVRKPEYIISLDHYIYSSLQPVLLLSNIENIIQDILHSAMT